MKVLDLNRVNNLVCECGCVMLNVDNKLIICCNGDCEQYRKAYKIPVSAYIELEEEKILSKAIKEKG